MRKRELSVDVLKIFAMLAVVAEHMMLSIESFSVSGGAMGVFFSMIRVFCKVNVDVFVIATAYLYVGRRTKTTNCVKIMLTTLTVSVLSYWITVLVFGEPLSLQESVKSLLPVLSGSYWFITSYIGLYLLIPFLNAVIEYFRKMGCLKTAALLLYIVSCIYPQLFLVNTEARNGGRTLFWMITLYILSGAVFCEKISTKKATVLYAGAYLLSVICRVALRSKASALFSNESALVVGMAFGLFIIVTNALKGKTSGTIAKILASSTLTVYLVHDSYLRGFLWAFVERMICKSWLFAWIAPVLIYCAGTAVHFLIQSVVSRVCSLKPVMLTCEKLQEKLYAVFDGNRQESASARGGI